MIYLFFAPHEMDSNVISTENDKRIVILSNENSILNRLKWEILFLKKETINLITNRSIPFIGQRTIFIKVQWQQLIQTK